MNRRAFLAGAAAGAAALGAVPAGAAAPPKKHPFKLKYAPHLGMFRELGGRDHLDQIRFMADAGFTAFEDNGLMGRSPEEQTAIGEELAKHGMTMGVFVLDAEFDTVTMAHATAEVRERLDAKVAQAIETAKRVNAKWMTVVPGRYDSSIEWDYQTANVIEHLKRCSGQLEPHGLTMVLEPINLVDCPNLFLTKIAQAYLICKAVGSPACKILDDLYHQQITEGNLIPNMEAAWSEIAYIQIGDNPGRKEPGTGEINYRGIFKWLHDRGFDGVLGMEHGNSLSGAEGEQAVIDAYVYADDF
jgi:hydroxypyruvate isomerase